MLLDDVRASLARAYDPTLVDEILSAYEETKRNFHAGGLRLAEVEGGRFCEAAFRMLELDGKQPRTPIGTELKTDELIRRLQALPGATFTDSIRLHIPRALRLVYDIRNKRDAAHLADGIDPNLQDATLVVTVLDWVLAEFIRMHHGVAANEAQRIVEQLVTRQVPAIELIDGFPKVLRTDLRASQFVLVLLYNAGKSGASIEQLEGWVRPSMRANLRRTLGNLDEEALVHLDRGTSRCTITLKGTRQLESRRLFTAD